MLTVLIATYNREQLLREVLESYLEIYAPVGGWKLVLVDNGSTDNTQQVIREYADLLPLESVYEPVSGQARALNRGLELVEGDLVVKSDDDSFPRRDWLFQLRKAADDNPDYDIFGGAILPAWEERPASSYYSLLPQAVLYALTDPQMEAGPCPANLVFGPNMAIRKRVLDAGYRFDENRGPAGRSYPMGCETALLMKLVRDGFGAWFVPDAQVYHFIRKEQLEGGWIFRRAVNFGRGQCLKVVTSEYSGSPVMFGVPRYMFKKFLFQLWQVFRSGISLRWPELVREVWQLMFLKGFIEESRHHPWQT